MAEPDSRVLKQQHILHSGHSSWCVINQQLTGQLGHVSTLSHDIFTASWISVRFRLNKLLKLTFCLVAWLHLQIRLLSAAQLTGRLCKTKVSGLRLTEATRTVCPKGYSGKRVKTTFDIAVKPNKGLASKPKATCLTFALSHKHGGFPPPLPCNCKCRDLHSCLTLALQFVIPLLPTWAPCDTADLHTYSALQFCWVSIAGVFSHSLHCILHSMARTYMTTSQQHTNVGGQPLKACKGGVSNNCSVQ